MNIKEFIQMFVAAMVLTFVFYTIGMQVAHSMEIKQECECKCIEMPLDKEYNEFDKIRKIIEDSAKPDTEETIEIRKD